MKKIKIRAATLEAGLTEDGVRISGNPFLASAFCALKACGADRHDHFCSLLNWVGVSMPLRLSRLDTGQQVLLHALELFLRQCALLVQREDIPQFTNAASKGRSLNR